MKDGKSERHVLFGVIDVARVQPTAVACETGVTGLFAKYFMTGGGGVNVSAVFIVGGQHVLYVII